MRGLRVNLEMNVCSYQLINNVWGKKEPIVNYTATIGVAGEGVHRHLTNCIPLASSHHLSTAVFTFLTRADYPRLPYDMMHIVIMYDVYVMIQCITAGA